MKKKNIILIVVAAIVLLVVCYFVCTKVFVKKPKKKVNTNREFVAEVEPADSDLVIKIYEHDGGYVITKKGYNSDDYKYLASYNCSSLNCKGYDVSPTGTKAIIFDNYTYYLYNYGNLRKEEVSLGNIGISNIEIIYSDRNVYGLYVINEENKGAFYNLDKNRYVTEFIYDGNASNKNDNLTDNNYFVGINNLGDGSTYTINIINNEAGDIVKILDSVTDIEKELKNVSLR